MKDLSRKNWNPSGSPWALFLWFLAANAVLTFLPLSLAGKILFLSFGLFLPLILGAVLSPRASAQTKPAYQIDPLPKWFLPPWVWLLLVAAAAFPRFWDLGNPAWWPVPDDALIAAYIPNLDLHWQWRLFETMSQVSVWLTYLGWVVFKITHSILISIQFCPAFASLLALGLGYGMARRFFLPTPAFIFFALLAFGYWPVFIAKPILSGITLLWEGLIFYALGRLHQRPQTTRMHFFSLGALAGLGPWVFFSWPIMILWLSLLLLARVTKRPPLPRHSVWFLTAGFLVFFIPFLILAVREGYGGHIRAVAAWNGFSSWRAQTATAWDYVQTLFWDGRMAGLWTPAQGGFLNPLVGALAWIGLLELYRHRRDPFAFWLLAAVGLFLLPGFLSHGLETFRIVLVLIPLLAVAALGLNRLLAATAPPRRPWVLVLALLVAGGWDVGRFFCTFPDSLRPDVDPHFNERRLSYEILAPRADREGPGLVFSEMVPFTSDNSLSVCAYPFNALVNPRLNPAKASWAAVFTEWNYVPALRKRFPGSQWKDLGPSPETPGLYQLGWVPLTPENRPIFEAWAAYYRSAQRIDFEYIDTPTGRPETQLLRDLLALYPSVPDDPYLQSCFLEKTLYYYCFEKTFYPQDPAADWRSFKPVLTRAFDKSLKDWVLCQKFGQVLESSGETAEARKLFGMALRQNPGDPDLQAALRRLGPP